MPFQLPADADPNSPQLKIVQDWNVGFRELNAEIIGKYLHKEFRRSVYPRSIGQPEQNKEEWLKELSAIIVFATGFDITVHSIVEAPGKVVIHTTSEVKNSVKMETIHESLFILHFAPEEDGSLKIKKLEDFRDSKVYLEQGQSLMAAIVAAQANK